MLMNVLLTSAGRRTSLLTFFQSAVQDEQEDGRVWAGDLDPLSAALQVAEHTVSLPPVADSDYIPTLLELTRAHDLDLIVPLIDPGLTPLANTRPQFKEEGCHPLVSAPALLDLTLDKWDTLQHFSEQEVRTPASWRPDTSAPADWPDPLFIKPRRGSASNSARALPRRHAQQVLPDIENPILQEVIDAPEITVDALFDFNGTLLHYVPRIRLRTMAGESIQGQTIADSELDAWLRPILTELGRLGAQGPITLQAFRTDPEPTLSEINPRFGGGFPLSHAAGAHYPAWLLQLCQGRALSPRLGQYTSDLCMTRAYTEWFVDASALPAPPQ